MELKAKIFALTTATTLVMGTAMPVFAGITGTASNSGNGAGSENKAKIEVDTTTTVVQDNEAKIINKIDLNSDTGHNKANYNTGGDVSITTGSASTLLSVKNSANANFAELDSCGGCDYDVVVENTQNGAESINKAKADIDNTTEVFQTNTAFVKNDLDVNTDTGHNKANYNTSDNGTVAVETGPSDTTVLVDNAVNSNHAMVGGGDGLSLGLDGDGQITVRNEGNGAFSENKAKAEVDQTTMVVQDNEAKVKNYLEVGANTGYNKAQYNTGGEVSVETGPVDLGIGVDNKVNLNAATVDACCDLDLTVENQKNGAESENKSKAEYDALLEAFQTNYGKAIQDITGDLDTGHNKVNYNTADGTLTGMIDAVVVVETEANTNILGEVSFDHFDWDGVEWDFEEMPGNGFFGWWFWMWLMR